MPDTLPIRKDEFLHAQSEPAFALAVLSVDASSCPIATPPSHCHRGHIVPRVQAIPSTVRPRLAMLEAMDEGKQKRPRRTAYPELRVVEVICQPDQVAIARAVTRLTEWWVLHRTDEAAPPVENRPPD